MDFVRDNVIFTHLTNRVDNMQSKGEGTLFE
jgi:hypothetical protein